MHHHSPRAQETEVRSPDPDASLAAELGIDVDRDPIRTRRRLIHPWYLGVILAISAYLFGGVTDFVQNPQMLPSPLKLVLTGLALLWYCLLPPLSWGRPLRRKLVLWAVLLVLVFTVVLLNDQITATYFAMFASAATAIQRFPKRIFLILLAVITGAAFVTSALRFREPLESLPISVVVGTVGLLIYLYVVQAWTTRFLRRTRHQLAEVAVAEERGRVAKDMHESWGTPSPSSR